jgi:hypothetical protein
LAIKLQTILFALKCLKNAYQTLPERLPEPMNSAEEAKKMFAYGSAWSLLIVAQPTFFSWLTVYRIRYILPWYSGRTLGHGRDGGR